MLCAPWLLGWMQVAQLYLTRPLLLEGRKLHMRLWVVVTHHAPMQAYLHRWADFLVCSFHIEAT